MPSNVVSCKMVHQFEECKQPETTNLGIANVCVDAVLLQDHADVRDVVAEHGVDRAAGARELAVGAARQLGAGQGRVGAPALQQQVRRRVQQAKVIPGSVVNRADSE